MTACVIVNGRTLMRPEDVGAAIAGRTGPQIKEAITANEAALRDAVQRNDHERVRQTLLNLKQSLDNAFAYKRDETGAWRSPFMFTGRKGENRGLDDIAAPLPEEYARTLYGLIKVDIITGRFEEYQQWLQSLHQGFDFLAGAGGTVVQVSPALFGDMTGFAQQAAAKLVAEGRQAEAIRVLAPLRREIESTVVLLPGGWSFRFESRKTTLGGDYAVCGRDLANAYLAVHNLPHAEDTIKVALGDANAEDTRISSLLIAASIKHTLGQDGYAKMYVSEALSALAKKPTGANVQQYFEFAEPALVPLMPAVRGNLAIVLGKHRLSPVETKNDDLLMFDTGFFLNRTIVIQRVLADQASRSDFETYVETERSLFQGGPGTPGTMRQTAALATLLVDQKQWMDVVTWLAPEIEGLEAVWHIEGGSATDLAQILKALSLSVYMLGDEGVRHLQARWPAMHEAAPRSAAETALALSEAAKWLVLGQAFSPYKGSSAGGLGGALRQELQIAFNDWLAGVTSATYYIGRRREILDRWMTSQGSENRGLPDSIAGFCRRAITRGDDHAQARGDVDVAFEVVGDTVVSFFRDGEHVGGEVSAWPYSSVSQEAFRLRAAAQGGDDGAVSTIAPKLLAGLCGSFGSAVLSARRVRVSSDAAIGMIPFDLLLRYVGPSGVHAQRSVSVPFLVPRLSQTTGTKHGRVKRCLLMGDPLPLDIKRSVSYTGNPTDDVAVALRGIAIQAKAHLGLQHTSSTSAGSSPFDLDILIAKVPYTAVEVSSLKESAQHRGYDATTLLGLDFNKKSVTQALQGEWGIAHFATHAFFTDEIPYIREPAIYVSPGLRPIDAFLLASEVRSIDMSGIETVVLSACNTGFDIAPNGAGIAGIASAFLVAGAKQVLLTLWAIDDEATAEFMRRFYGLVLDGADAGDALEQAKNQLAADSRYASSRFWAPFILFSHE